MALGQQSIDLYNAGMSLRRVAHHEGVATSAVFSYLKKCGVNTRSEGWKWPTKNKYSTECVVGLVAKYEAGMSIQEISESSRISLRAVNKLIEGRVAKRKSSHKLWGQFGKQNNDRSVNSLLAKAIHCGVLKRPDVCEKCGNSGRMKDGRSLIHAHHDDYNKPFDVRWLCCKCHLDWHRSNVAIPANNSSETIS